MTESEMTMVERVARALALTAAASGSKGDDLLRDLAFSAIKEMREPTIDMEIAGTEQWLCIAATEDRSTVNWRAMIDAALMESLRE